MFKKLPNGNNMRMPKDPVYIFCLVFVIISSFKILCYPLIVFLIYPNGTLGHAYEDMTRRLFSSPYPWIVSCIISAGVTGIVFISQRRVSSPADKS